MKIICIGCQARATNNTLRRFCPRRILATHESAVCQQTTFHKCSNRITPTTNPQYDKRNFGWKAYMRFLTRGTAQVNTPNANGDGPLQAETTLLRQRYRSSEYSKWHGILAIWILKSAVFALAVVRTSTSRPYRPLGHIFKLLLFDLS